MRRWCRGSLNCVEMDRNLGISSSSPELGQVRISLPWGVFLPRVWAALEHPGGTNTDGAISVG